MKILTILMILLSLFVGIPLNGMWIILYKFEFVNFPHIIGNSATGYEIFLWIMLLISHLGICSLPFLYKNEKFKNVIIWAPTVFILCFSLLEFTFLILLIPFIVCWVFTIDRYRSKISTSY